MISNLVHTSAGTKVSAFLYDGNFIFFCIKDSAEMAQEDVFSEFFGFTAVTGSVRQHMMLKGKYRVIWRLSEKYIY